MIRITRRDFAMAAGAALVTREIQAQTKEAGLITRAIPATGELLPAVGLGTAYVFDRSDERTRQAAAEVVRTLIEGGRPDNTGNTGNRRASARGWSWDRICV